MSNPPTSTPPNGPQGPINSSNGPEGPINSSNVDSPSSLPDALLLYLPSKVPLSTNAKNSVSIELTYDNYPS
ncbi:hypothetical protein LIER_12928 [Lithospermum erythrorhizon]|uniref:Uncharacterized protein n=1 Tax=Lithospermum erythrorhizon TaxID=34254 RepID=A0AAV3PVM6_LITER